MKYILNLLYVLDLLANALFGGARLQTISARWGASPTKTILFYWGCKLLGFFFSGHCQASAEAYAKIKEAQK
jgi:hypothetical protein